MEFTLKIPSFEGPLDLLEHLIKKNKLNICSVSLIQITDQYIEYVENMQQLDLDISSEFLVVASNLLYIKSKELLPKHEDGDEDAEQIAKDLTEALKKRRIMKLVSEMFKKKKLDGELNFYKDAENIEFAPVQKEVEPVELDKLMEAFFSVIEKSERKAPPPKANFDGIVGHEKVSVRKKAGGLIDRLKKKSKISFEDAFSDIKSKSEAVALFLAILELLKTNAVIAGDDDNGSLYFVLGNGVYDEEGTFSGEFDG